MAIRIARWSSRRSIAWPVGNANVPSGKPPQIAQSQILRRVTGGRSPLWADHSFTSFVSVLYFGDATAMARIFHRNCENYSPFRSHFSTETALKPVE
jgi:hypothetical protein